MTTIKSDKFIRRDCSLDLLGNVVLARIWLLHGGYRPGHGVAFLQTVATIIHIASAIVSGEILHVFLVKLWFLKVEDLCLWVSVSAI